MRGPGVGSVFLGRAGYVAACLAAAVVLVTAGYVHGLVGLTRQLEGGASIGDSSSVGAMNILLMGLESRTNFKGQALTSHQLNVTHSGRESAVQAGTQGSQDTDTLILVHVFAGGQKAVGYSIPRDDVVNFPHATFDGITEGKIDGAYAYAYDQYVSDNFGKMSSKALYLGANQAGQAFEVQTVESVTGVHIDHFVVSNIYGFYLLAGQFGGIEVCIRPAPGPGGLPGRREPDRHRHAGVPANQQLELQRLRGRLQQGEGRRAVPAPGPGAVTRVRPVARHAARHRRGPDPSAAGGPRLHDLEIEEPGPAERPGPDLRHALQREPVPPRGPELQPSRLRHQHEGAERLAPVPHHAAGRRGAEHLDSSVRESAAGCELHLRAGYPAAASTTRSTVRRWSRRPSR